MPIPGVTAVAQKITNRIGDLIHRIVRTLLRPASASILATAVLDLSRSKADLIAENALLRCRRPRYLSNKPARWAEINGEPPSTRAAFFVV